jgi:UDP-N-acetylglucosamine acyltransferase
LQIEEIYRTLYVRGYNVSNALNIVEKEVPDSLERNQIIDFIRSSVDGIMRGASAD